MKNQTYFVILDQSLKDGRGHHFELACNLSKGAIDLGFKTLWLTHSDFASYRIPFEVNVERIFSSTMYDKYMLKNSNDMKNDKQPSYSEFANKIVWKISRYKELLNLILTRYFGRTYLRSNNKPAVSNSSDKSLLQIIKEYSLGADDHILIHTGDGNTYKYIRDLFIGKNINHLPNIHIATPYDMNTMPNQTTANAVPKMVRHLKHTGLLNDKVFLYGENKPLSGELSTWVQQKVTPLNLPPPDIKYTDQQAKKDTLNIVYVGAARIEKGFLLLPKIVESLWDDYGKNNKIKFTIQCSPQIIGYLPVITAAIEKLKGFPKDYVQLRENQQSTEEYYHMLDNADIVLLCYEKEKYHVRGSGIAVESVSMGKILVTTTGTFPAYIAEDSASTGENINEYITAITDILNNIEKYRNAAKRVSNHYRKKFSNTSYIKTLVNNAEPIKPKENKDLKTHPTDNSVFEIISHRNNVDTIRKLIALRKGEFSSDKTNYSLPLLLKHIDYEMPEDLTEISQQSKPNSKVTEQVS